jgi:hypothetical protein
MRPARLLIPLGVWVLGLPWAARGQTPDSLEARAAADRAALARDDRATRLWVGGWAGFFTTAAALRGSAAVQAGDTADGRIAAVNAGGCSLGLGGLLINAVRPGVELPPPDASPLEVRLALVAQAERASTARGWFGHTASAAVAVGTSLYFWLGLERPGMAMVNLPVSLLIGELQIATVPTHSLDRLEAEP